MNPLLWLLPTLASAALPFLGTRSTIAPSPEPLTTDKVWTIDPGEVNPARAIFALHRDVKLEGFRTVPRPNGHFGISVDAIQSVVTPYYRAPGSHAYRPAAEFPCAGSSPVEGYATLEGARQGAAAAAAAWDAEAKEESVKLGTLLRRLDEPKEDEARQAAQLLFDAWLKDTTALWRPKAARAARKASWEAETQEAIDAGICIEKNGTLRPTAAAKAHGQWTWPNWEDAMEPVPPEPEKPYPLPIARAPARRWDGAFSVRAMLDAAGMKKLDGQFLLDSATPETIVSPDWLRGQGILPPLIEVTGAALARALFTGGQSLNSSELSRQGRVTAITLSGLELPIHDVLIHDTELYAPPENISTCCNGILGLDFLQHYVFQFRPGPPLEVVLWPRENFHPVWASLPDPVWIEASVTPSGSIVSSCELKSEDGKRAMTGVLWDTAAAVALEAHTPWQSAAGHSWNIICGHLSEAMASGVTAETHVESSPFSHEKNPAVTVGIPLLARGSFILDLPHGRIWFSKGDLSAPIHRNSTGLTVAFDYLGDDRVLKVLSISSKKSAPVAALAAAGLRVGSVITEVDGQQADELDLWEVEQKLAGARGPEVRLSWVSSHGPGRGTGKATQGVLKISR